MDRWTDSFLMMRNLQQPLLVSVEVVQERCPLDTHALRLLHLLLPVHSKERIVEQRDREQVVQHLSQIGFVVAGRE